MIAHQRICQTFFSFRQTYRNCLHKHSCMYLACTVCGLLTVLTVLWHNHLPVYTAVAPYGACMPSFGREPVQARRACCSSKFRGSHATQNVHWHLFHRLWSRVYGTVRRARHNNPSFARTALTRRKPNSEARSSCSDLLSTCSES